MLPVHKINYVIACLFDNKAEPRDYVHCIIINVENFISYSFRMTSVFLWINYEDLINVIGQ